MTKTFHSQYADNHQESTGLLFARVYNAWHGRVKAALQKVGLTSSAIYYSDQFRSLRAATGPDYSGQSSCFFGYGCDDGFSDS